MTHFMGMKSVHPGRRGVTRDAGAIGRAAQHTRRADLPHLKAGRLDLEPIISERLPLGDYQHAFDLLAKGEASKILLYPNGIP